MKPQYTRDWERIARDTKVAVNWRCELCGVAHGPVPKVLTVHHINYDPQNNNPANLAALCQRCHLSVQGWIVQPADHDALLRRKAEFGEQLTF